MKSFILCFIFLLFNNQTSLAEENKKGLLLDPPLVSPANCLEKSKKEMRYCSAPFYNVSAEVSSSSVLPLKTLIEWEKSPECRTLYLLNRELEYFVGDQVYREGMEEIELSGNTTVLRDKTIVTLQKIPQKLRSSVLDFEESHIDHLRIEAESETRWEMLPFTLGCTVKGRLLLNQPLVKNRDDARDIINQYHQELSLLSLEIKLKRKLIEHQKLFQLMDQVASNLLEEATEEKIKAMNLKGFPSSVLQKIKDLMEELPPDEVQGITQVKNLVALIEKANDESDPCWNEDNLEECMKDKKIIDLLPVEDRNFYLFMKHQNYLLANHQEELTQLEEKAKRIKQMKIVSTEILKKWLDMPYDERIKLAQQELTESLETRLAGLYETIFLKLRSFSIKENQR